MEALKNATFNVEIDGLLLLCYLCGRMRFNSVNVGIGDFVEVVVDPYGGKGTNRIIRRL